VAGVRNVAVGYENGDAGIGWALVCVRETGCDGLTCTGVVGDC
jgi:hypothetical protein